MLKGFRPRLEPPSHRQVRAENITTTTTRRQARCCVALTFLVVTFVFAVFAASGWNLYVHQYDVTQHFYHDGDQVALSQASNDFSSVLCEAYQVKLEDPGTIYRLPHRAEINQSETLMERFAMHRGKDREYSAREFYLLNGSRLDVVACHVNESTGHVAPNQILFIKGKHQFVEWHSNRFCKDCIDKKFLIPNDALCPPTLVDLHHWHHPDPGFVDRRPPVRFNVTIRATDHYALIVDYGLHSQTRATDHHQAKEEEEEDDVNNKNSNTSSYNIRKNISNSNNKSNINNDYNSSNNNSNNNNNNDSNNVNNNNNSNNDNNNKSNSNNNNNNISSSNSSNNNNNDEDPKRKKKDNGENLVINMVLTRTLFELRDSSRNCTFLNVTPPHNSSCTFRLSWNSDLDLVVDFSADVKSDYHGLDDDVKRTFRTHCHLRMLFWVLLFAGVPFVLAFPISLAFYWFMCRRRPGGQVKVKRLSGHRETKVRDDASLVHNEVVVHRDEGQDGCMGIQDS